MENKCKYCGADLSEADIKYRLKACGKCRDKLPAVKKLCAIFEKIKKASGKYG
jgi:hypothetical protein